MAISQIQSASLASGVPASSNMPAGSVLQVVQFSYNGQASWTGSSRSTQLVIPGDFGDGTVSITRISATSKILVDVRLEIGCDSDAWASFVMQYAPQGSGYSNFPNLGTTVGGVTTAGCLCHFGTSSGGGAIPDSSYCVFPATYSYLLDPSTAQNKVFVRIYTTYGHSSSSRTLYLNRPSNTGDNNRYTSNSTITLTEIAV